MPYITTSRKASQVTRRLARSLSHFFPESYYENRGKRDMDSVLARARQLGFARVVFVYESHGNPSEIDFIDVGKDSWSRAGKISFTVVAVGKVPKGPYALECDGSACNVAALFRDPGMGPDDEGHEGDTVANLSLRNNYLTFSIGGKETIKLKMAED
ncbi:MAG: hypothetical protein QXU54_01390 [Candidatus Micrarchaeia archaeon]